MLNENPINEYHFRCHWSFRLFWMITCKKHHLYQRKIIFKYVFIPCQIFITMSERSSKELAVKRYCHGLLISLGIVFFNLFKRCVIFFFFFVIYIINNFIFIMVNTRKFWYISVSERIRKSSPVLFLSKYSDIK